MNKKVSTLFAASLLFSSAFGSAYAETKPLKDFIKGIATEIKTDGTQYLIVEDLATAEIADNGDYALGFKYASEDNTDKIEVLGDQLSKSVDENDLQQYLWTAQLTYVNTLEKTQPYYIFTNVKTKKVLTVNADKDAFITDFSAANKANVDAGSTALAFADWTVYDKNNYNKQLVAVGSSNVLDVNAKAFVSSGESGNLINIYEPTENVPLEDKELNELYNGKGFSFGLENDEVENIFNQRIYAVKTGTNGVNIDSSKDLKFPAGTYFLTDVVLAEGKTEVNATNIDWLKSTFIVVSSTQTVEQTKDDREAGNGYQFVEMTGEQLNKYTGTDTRYMAEGSEVSVYNACFTVVKGISGNYPYALKLANFRYNKPIKDDANNQETVTNMYINVTAHGTPAVNYLTTDIDATGYKYIFKKNASNLKKGLDLLNTDGTAAVYNIQFVSGSGENSELNKYLTFGVEDGNSTSYEWTAEGALLADLNTPEYQFLITDVDADNNVTFTNRENGKTIKIQLFEEENGAYSTSGSSVKIQPVTIERNGYAVTADDEWEVSLNNTLIKLIPSTVDQYAGFLNVDDKTVVTLAYSRDNNKTSNKYYAVVEDKGKGVYNFKNNDDAVSTEVYDAAQWQLNKSEYPVYIKRSYVYNENGKLAYKANADVVAAYKYTLRYLNDGDETDYYYTTITTSSNLGYIKLDKDDEWEVIIKIAKDGAASIIKADEAFKNTAVINTPSKAVVGGGMTINETSGKVSFGQRLLYPEKIADNSLKSYLLTDAPVNSWTKAGHVSLQSELGNYISMDENNDGIVVNNEEEVYYLHITDEDAVIPSFYVSRGIAGDANRLFMYNPVDSVSYQVNMTYDPDYQWKEGATKVIFKEAQYLDADTLATEVKGNIEKVSNHENTTDGTLAGLDRFKFQIVETEDGDSHYYIRQSNSGNEEGNYLASWNEKLTWSDKTGAMVFTIKEAAAPTANESISATDVKVVALDGAVNVKNAAGKNVVVSTILGQIVANEVLTSDNATISVPAGIAIVSVDGEEAVKVSVK